MRRHEMEHLIRAAASITECEQIIVIGSQAILGTFPQAPDELLASMEADLIPVEHPERWGLIDGSIGEMSPFDETFGYYADGVEESTAILPENWKSRLVTVKNENTNQVKGLCLEVVDLMVSKLLAGREKDVVFVQATVKHRLVNVGDIVERISLVSGHEERKELALARLERMRG